MLAQMITNDTAYNKTFRAVFFPSPCSFNVLIHLTDVSVTVSSHSIDADL